MSFLEIVFVTFLVLKPEYQSLYDRYEIPKLKNKIFFVHFRNTTGNKQNFRETFHDNGQLDMSALIKCYKENEIDVPIRVDHVPLMSGEKTTVAGYSALGRLYAIGYLKGLLEGSC